MGVGMTGPPPVTPVPPVVTVPCSTTTLTRTCLLRFPVSSTTSSWKVCVPDSRLFCTSTKFTFVVTGTLTLNSVAISVDHGPDVLRHYARRHIRRSRAIQPERLSGLHLGGRDG